MVLVQMCLIGKMIFLCFLLCLTRVSLSVQIDTKDNFQYNGIGWLSTDDSIGAACGDGETIISVAVARASSPLQLSAALESASTLGESTRIWLLRCNGVL